MKMWIYMYDYFHQEFLLVTTVIYDHLSTYDINLKNMLIYKKLTIFLASTVSKALLLIHTHSYTFMLKKSSSDSMCDMFWKNLTKIYDIISTVFHDKN